MAATKQSDSVLLNTKKILGLVPGYDVFDMDIITHINSSFSTLEQLGIGPEGGFSISGESEVWSDFLGEDPRMNSVKTLVYLKVRLLFDPPTSSFAITAMEKQIQELEWRLSVTVDPPFNIQLLDY